MPNALTGYYPPDLANQNALAGYDVSNYGAAPQADYQKILADPSLMRSSGDALAYVIQAMGAGDTQAAQQLMQQHGVTQDQVNQQLASTPGRNSGGLVGNALNRIVRPVGEYVTEHPAALFAAPFIAAGALGAFGGSLGAAGGGGATSYGSGLASASDAAYGSVAGDAAAGESVAGSLTAGAETLGNGLAAHPFLSGLNALAGGSGGSMGITDWLNLGNTVLGAAAANRAGNIQSGATDAANAEIRREFDINQGNAAPYQAAGVKALGNLADPNANFQASPDYAFRRSEGQRDIGNSFAARGGAFSGNALKALDQYNSSLASGEFGNWWNRQAGLAGVGQTANGQIGVLGQNASNNIAGNTIAGGDARASGLLNTAGVLAGGARNGIGNYLYRTAPYQPYGGYSPYQGYGG